MHIAFFDSGLGGISIAREVFRHPDFDRYLKPSVQYCSYIADTAAFPYGNKPTDWLKSRVCQVVEACLDTIQANTPKVNALKIDALVIACNTASTIALDALREQYQIPIIGVVPAVKPAASASQSKNLGILATPATISRDYTTQLIEDYAPDCTVALWGSEALVHQAELQLLGKTIDQTVIEQELLALMTKQPNLDTIVLACTHFPLLKPIFKQILPNIQWVDSGEAIARRVVQITKANKLIKQQTRLPNTPSEQTKLTSMRFNLLTTGGDKSATYASHCSRIASHVGTFKTVQHNTIDME